MARMLRVRDANLASFAQNGRLDHAQKLVALIVHCLTLDPGEPGEDPGVYIPSFHLHEPSPLRVVRVSSLLRL